MKKGLSLFCLRRTRMSCVSEMQPFLGKVVLAFSLVFICFNALAGMGVHNVFAGRESILLQSVDGVAERDKLTFRVTKEHRTLAAGPVLAGKDGRVELPVVLPGMKPGVAMKLELTLSKDGDNALVSLASGKVWAFAEQPFATGENPAVMKKIYLYDPENKTAEAFESIKLRVDRIDDFNALESVTNAWVVFHEGFSLESVRGIDEVLLGLVRRGNSVLLLAPSEGNVPLWNEVEECWYGTAEGLHKQTKIEGTDYDLDLSSMQGSHFRLVGLRDEAVVQVDAGKGYEAVILRDLKNDGKIVFCGLNLISNWEKTPAARWLLAEILLLQ